MGKRRSRHHRCCARQKVARKRSPAARDARRHPCTESRATIIRAASRGAALVDATDDDGGEPGARTREGVDPVVR
jgi:hypothetical protein